MVEVRQKRQLLRRGVRSELYIAPVLILVPLVLGVIFIENGVRIDSLQYQAIGIVLIAGNLFFDFLMVITALRFLRDETASPP